MDHSLKTEMAELATGLRQEIAELGEENAQVDKSLRAEIARVERELGRRIEESNVKLVQLASQLSQYQETVAKQVEAVKVDLLKWSFAFWAPVVMALVALYLKG
jgi:septal ring factor EnvC (AmiA/AmiB activator)